MAMTFEKCCSHIPEIPAQEIERYAIEEVFKLYRYIFTRREGKKQYGYCTYCHKEFSTAGLYHNEKTTCPECDSLCTVKASGKGRKRLINEAYFTYYLKSAIEPEAIAAVGIYAVQDFSGEYWDVRTLWDCQSMYVFEPGIGGSAFHRAWIFYSQARTMNMGSFRPSKSCKCRFDYGHNYNIYSTYSRESIAVAVAGTLYLYSTWENYDVGDMTEFSDLYSKYPCVEYLTKLGFGHLIEDKLTGDRTYSAINWRGKTLLRVLGLTKQELQTIKKQDIHMTFLDLRLLQLGKKDGSKFTPTESVKLSQDWAVLLDDWMKLRQYGSIRQVNHYLTKQSAKKYHNNKRLAFIAWRDYIHDCITLGLNLTRERVVFPGNLYRAHQNTIKQVKIKADEDLNKKIRDRAKSLYKKYYFEHQGLFIKPAESSNDLIAEGKALDHCVGTYASRYASGEIVLLFIRKMSEPDKSFFTMEIKNGVVVQVRGFENCDPNEQVWEFVEVFRAEKLRRKKRESKVRISA
ncbi:PcfJ-like protein [Desulfotomaculum arcticum]|uniref:PcfJ-like protein n=1 Tax=Desulfotruncus arcticus DSM 17038 TaxID=1121424 RepID=A0A1I2ZG34_9FIRM|nr:PcfJ domain-containing protein [Desulfotruncus arcticus]SFH36479.1 PcfJ-like protein [Desulfotomaculum arcticum] [Desulfotruncus arcticus DSM 17038]